MDNGRRRFLMTTLFGAGGVGLRALATGLPAWFVLNPRAATAQDLKCLLTSTAQYLIVSASSAGDAINCNAPGTYDAGGVIIHPTQFPATPVTLGSVTVNGAPNWQSDLTDATRARTAFFHHVTGGLVHGDHPKVMAMTGDTANAEMYISNFAKHLAPCLGTVQAQPVVLGATSSLELVKFSGLTLPQISPTQLKQLLTGSATDPLVKLRAIRDQTLNQLNALAKSSGTNVQKAFLDAFALSQTQVRQLSADLATTLAAITDDSPGSQALAAAALVSAKVTPVVTVHIPFSGDNHSDSALYQEWFQTTNHDGSGSGVAGIQAIQAALASLNVQDSATFATANVFGRTLNNTATVEALNGRDHYGAHTVTVVVGKNVSPGVYGGVAEGGLAGSPNFGATDIDSTTGQSVPNGTGDIPFAQTQVSMVKTLGAMLGIPQSVMANDFTTAARGKPIPSAVVNYPG
jgi:hypothetical protein